MYQADIPGGTATFRDAAELRQRDRKLIKAASIAAGPAIAKLPQAAVEAADAKVAAGEDPDQVALDVGPMADDVHWTLEESMAMLTLYEASIVATLSGWSLDQPLPTMETIGDLPADLYDALEDAVKPKAKGLAAETDFEPHGDGRSGPTGTSGSSDSTSTEAASSLSTPTLASGGESTTTESSSA